MRLRRLTLLAATAALVVHGAATPAYAEDVTAPLVAIDAGHGGDDYGTNGVVGTRRLLEKELTLRVARMAADGLKAAGYRTMLIRSEDADVNRPAQDRNGDGKVDLADELQTRVDKANDAGAALLVSIHFNGSPDRSLHGPQVYYSAARPFAAENRKLAERIMTSISARLAQPDRAVIPGSVLRDSILGGSLFLLGPQGGHIARPSKMPGVLIEGLFLTNADDAGRLADGATLQSLASAYVDGVSSYLGPPPKPKPKPGLLARIGDAGAFLRPAPLLGTKPLATLDAGTPVDLAEPAKGDPVDGSADWWRVNVAGQAGYVFAALLDVPEGAAASAAATTTKPAAPPSAARKVTVRDDDGRAARLRPDPSRDGDIVARARPGETLDVLDEATGDAVDGKNARWLKVRRGDVVGWVWSGLVDA